MRNRLNAFVTRLLAGPKQPFLLVATTLGMCEEGLERMRLSGAEDCEQVLLRHLARGHGGVVDWRAGVADVLEAIDPVLTTEERAALGEGGEAGNPGFPDALRLLDARLRPPLRALRAIGSLGDAYLVFLAPRTGLAELDDAARAWLI